MSPVLEYWLVDERGLDADQFADAQVYAVARTLAEAQEDRTEAGAGVIVEVAVEGDTATWVRAHA